MFDPVATYRIQFHKDFTFHDLERIIPYLQKLGIKTIYASPIFTATPGSTHGYDGLDPNTINPEIGTEEQLRIISQRLKTAGISWLQDIVPNHMAFHPDNKWLMDVLEKGRDSKYGLFFDIDWDSDVYEGKIMVPFLGAGLEDAIKKGELKLALHKGKVVFQYYDSMYPLNEQSLRKLTDRIEQANQDPEVLLSIANEQHYRLCHWQETDRQINYRRFFTINGLICVNIQDEKVFSEYHRLIRSLVSDGVFSGLRVDHIDGLYDPTEYLDRLREAAGEETYIVVEKILQPGEKLPKEWPVEGNTGYDFLAMVNNLFTNRKAENKFTGFYKTLVNNSDPIERQQRQKKAYILYNHMAGELENLYQLFNSLKLEDTSAIPKETIKQAIGEFLVECPVYRYYGTTFPLGAEEVKALKSIFTDIVARRPDLAAALVLLEEALLVDPLTSHDERNRNIAHFYKRCMQFSGPLMAKGVEDTLMYTYNRFIGHNDVGDSPEAFGFTVEHFHQLMIDRQQHWPLSLNGTSTHDTKRGEDVRARLNVLTDLDDEWFNAVNEWQTMNAKVKTKGMPDANDEYLIYQSLIGAYPFEEDERKGFVPRFEEFLQKALREAKIHSNWTSPNEAYEDATKDFTRKLLDPGRPFLASFEQFLGRIADAGMVNSLAQLVLKFTCPGVPDLYQGTELWDFSLVDPDNRRAVDYNEREQILEGIGGTPQSDYTTFLIELWKNRKDGTIKLWLTSKLLAERGGHSELFASGQYLPLKVEGRYQDNVLAFARRHRDTWYVIAVSLHIARLCKEQDRDITDLEWRNTRIVLRPESPIAWTNLASGDTGKADKEILVKDVFKQVPLALLKMQQPQNDRGAGILLAISSLPSSFGVGDMGPQAKAFARALSRSRQKYWQILPLNPTEAGSGHSPYSSYSSMGGNPLLISPELLAEEGLLTKEQLEQYHLPSTDMADYMQAQHLKDKLLDLAYEEFSRPGHHSSNRAFEFFCEKEAYWLNDMALYLVLKQHQNGKPWHQWEEHYKRSEHQALEKFSTEHVKQIRKVKWLQYVFLEQWKSLRDYANGLGVQLFGDMPFYVSYDSVDVWAHPDIFCLDKNFSMTGIAGVPPDYFSEDGQFWGMPTFNWTLLKEQNYDWWVLRLRKNLELFDLLRIDHFRAFQEYWQVPAGEVTARKGEWIPGPGKDFFDIMKKELGVLPFVAEDLGDKMEPVYDLRDEIGLPGMKVLQFAWGENMPRSVDIPHNHQQNTIVYTGTHDNNTTIGWYLEETNRGDHERMHHYMGIKVKQKNIHEILSRLAYSSVARIAMLPLQDILGLGAESRMNTPGKAEGNWLWRLKPGQLTPDMEAMLRDWVETYNRA